MIIIIINKSISGIWSKFSKPFKPNPEKLSIFIILFFFPKQKCKIEPSKGTENPGNYCSENGIIKGTKKSKIKDSDKKMEENVNIPSNVNIKNKNEPKKMIKGIKDLF